MRGYHRREFVVRAVALCGASVVAPSLALGRERSRGEQVDATFVARVANEYFGGRTGTAQMVGGLYLKGRGAESSRAAILAAASGAAALIGRASSAPEAIAALADAISRDYRGGRSVQVDGWVLAQTEVEVCVLTLLPAVL